MIDGTDIVDQEIPQEQSAAFLLKLLEQEKASQSLAQAQLESLLNKKKELEMLSKKLAFLKSLQEKSLSEQLEIALPAEESRSTNASSNFLVEQSEPQSVVVSDTLFTETTTEYPSDGSEPKVKTVTTLTHSEPSVVASRTVETEESGNTTLNITQEEHVDFVISTEGAARAAEALELSQEQEIERDSNNEPEAQENEEVLIQDSDAAAFQSKLLRLVEQEQELARLEAQLASLQALKEKMKSKQATLEKDQRIDTEDQRELEDALAMIESELSKSKDGELEIEQRQVNAGSQPSFDDKEQQEDEEESIETLLNRLAQASVKESFTEDLFNAVPQVSTSSVELKPAPQTEAMSTPSDQNKELSPEQRDEVIRLLEEDAIMVETSERIREGITQILAQMQDLVDAQEATESVEEKQFIAALFSKLAGQLEELKAAYEKLQKLQTLLRAQKLEATTIRESTGIQTSNSKQDISFVQEPDMPQHEDIYSSSTQTEPSLQSEQVTSIPTWKKPQESIAPEQDSISVSQPAEQLAIEDPQLKSLFESRKDEIYKGAATLISSFERDPYFLLALFRKLPKLKSNYARQCLMFAVDEILDDVLTQTPDVAIVSEPVINDDIPYSRQCCEHDH